MLTSNQIRSDFIKFFEERNHKIVPSSPVVPIGDDTLLFINAGMNQFKDIFLGLNKPDYNRAANSQKCIRAGGKHNDLEEVGVDTYHHTFFEMLGNWSFGDYFKAEAIEWAWELLVNVWKMNPERLHATYFEGDKTHGIEPDIEARKLWGKYLPDERIHPGNLKDNFWEMGDTGPCGPCSEIHYDDTPDLSGGKLVNKDNPNVIEIWNLVFIQFNRDSRGKLSPLPARHVDTGMGLERVARFMQGKKSNYDTDLFTTLIEAIGKITGQRYGQSETDRKDIAFRVIADHLRTVTFAITDNCTPSNEGRGYVIRRILRRAARFGRVLGMQEPFIYKLVPTLTELMGDAFGEIRERQQFVQTVIESEEASFGRTLDRGINLFSSAAESAEKSKDKTISGDEAFQLYDTYGFPLDLTQLMARERGLKVDTDKFDILMNIQRQLSRTAQEGDKLKQSLSGVELPITDDNLKYETETCKAVIQGWVSKDGYSTEGILSVTGEPIGLVLDHTCFYPEAGGQVGDCGIIKSQKGEFKVETTEKIADCIIHQGKLISGSFSVGDTVTITVDESRQDTKKNHTATHLLQWALRSVLGDSVHQQGSLVSPPIFRFDFTYPKALTDKEIERVEDLVRDKIEAALPVTCAVMPIDQAKKLGAMALFGEKYGNEVRVMAIGAKDKSQINSAFSKELCGGTHVSNTSEIICFKILKEESISAGVRRITGTTGNQLISYLEYEYDAVVKKLTKLLDVREYEIVPRIKDLIDKNKKLTKELKNTSKQAGADTMSEARSLLEKAEKIGDAFVVIGKLSPTNPEQARAAIDMVKKKAKSAVVVFGYGEGDKANLIVGVTDDLIKKVKAGDIVKQIAPLIDGGGGGRPQMAQAGGKDPSKIEEALKKAAELIKNLL
ncbi:MAG: alanine--tRNA ligase [Sedimentisphaerales bacterium]|nr:alanine--tRNA ligase [Sedimentisphaerales bacterium]